jgi:hypothetical protein
MNGNDAAWHQYAVAPAAVTLLWPAEHLPSPN